MPLIPPDLIAALAAEAGASDAARRLSQASVAAMREAGLWRALVPRRAGGDERDMAAMREMVTACAEGSAAAAWVLMVSLAHDFAIGSFPEQAQDDVWAGGPDDVTPGSLAPGGTLTRDGDGWRLSGRWPFNSGAHHGQWFLFGAIDRGGAEPRLVHVVVPRADCDLDDDWHAVGLRGTGSVNARVNDAPVPAHRTLDSGVLLGARSPHAHAHATSLYRTPLLAGLVSMLATVTLAIARPGIAATIELVGGQRDRYTGLPKQDRPGLQMRIAEASAELRAAELLLDDQIALLARFAGGEDSEALRARARFQGAYIVELSRRAIDRVMQAAGGRAAFDSSPVQRAWRDVAMAAKHELASFDVGALIYGRSLLGLDAGPTPL